MSDGMDYFEEQEAEIDRLKLLLDIKNRQLRTARAEALEEAARIADSHAHGSDKRFKETIRKASASGNARQFDLAAACAAGMDHEAREIAAAIRAAKEPQP